MIRIRPRGAADVDTGCQDDATDVVILPTRSSWFSLGLTLTQQSRVRVDPSLPALQLHKYPDFPMLAIHSSFPCLRTAVEFCFLFLLQWECTAPCVTHKGWYDGKGKHLANNSEYFTCSATPVGFSSLFCPPF